MVFSSHSKEIAAESTPANKHRTEPSPHITSTEGGAMRIPESKVAVQTTDTFIRVKRPKHVLDEDEYANTLEAIITRDYFSGYEQNETVPDMSLDEFQAKYTSEDNDSFNALVETELAANRAKYHWLWNESRGQKTWEIEESKEKLMIKDSRPTALNYSQMAAKNAVMFVPDGYESATREQTSRGDVVPLNTRLGIKAQSKPRPFSLPASNITLPSSDSAGRPTVNSYSFVTASTFKIAGPSKREQVHEDLLNKISDSKHRPSTLSVDKKSGRIMKTPAQAAKNVVPMSPAAARILKGMKN